MLTNSPMRGSQRPPHVIEAMREELRQAGVRELMTPVEVEAAFDHKEGTMLLVVNSVCGCSGSSARPAVAMALQGEVRPERVFSVFAGQELEATQRARDLMPSEPPSSPSVFLFKDGELVYRLHRPTFQRNEAPAIAGELTRVFAQHCASL